MQRPFRILGVQQIAIGGLNKNELTHFWLELLGLEKTGSFKSEKENVDEDIVTLGKGLTAVEIDLMVPIDPEKKPKVHEPPLNHIGLWVDDLEKAVKYLTERGVRLAPGGIRKGASGYDVCFLHPKGNEEFPIGAGILLELVQAPPELVAFYNQSET